MLSILLKAAGFASFVSYAAALGCVPREGAEFTQNPSFEEGEWGWGYGSNVILQQSTPAFPAHSGEKALLVKASYTKATEGTTTNNYAYVQQFVGSARTGNTYRIRAHYKVLSHTKGASCPEKSLPLTTCKLRVSYVNQNMASIHLNPTSDYVEFNVDFIPESSGRYLSFNLECNPTPATPGCGEMTILLDDITWTDPGHVCWTTLGCYVDSVSSRILPDHGRLPNWPHTTTIESCQQACGAQGHIYAGLEFGAECFCGDAFVGNTLAPASECNMPCSNNGQQLCGGPDRVDVYQKP